MNAQPSLFDAPGLPDPKAGCREITRPSKPGRASSGVSGRADTSGESGGPLEGKRDRHWADPSRENRPAHFVPQSDLRDTSTISRVSVAV